MSTIKEELQSLSQSLSGLAKDLNKIAKRVEKMEPPPAPKAKKAPAKKAAAKKPAAPKKKAAPVAAKTDTVLDQVFDVVRRSRNGATIAKLKDKTGLSARQLSNALYKLSKRGKIESVARGQYVKKKA